MKSFGKKIAETRLWFSDLDPESVSILTLKDYCLTVYLKGSGLLIHNVNIDLKSNGRIY